ncbi:MAG: hypothetical protein J0I20_31470 [Chloroflexi bacterium]|nr:hypothetical protein [Chloroflexota bacterium]OJV93651.1 MAG: hypothetical protein BGO39_15135 [Chloroflexi bacterium 54-19]
MAEKLKRLWRLQWQINVATGVFSAIAIGLAYANQALLAQLTMLPILACFGAACWVAYVRYKLNKQRRTELFAQLESEHKDQLREVFDQARRERNLPPDSASPDGFTATVDQIQTQARRQAQSNLPPGVKRRGNNPDGKR